MKDKNGSGGWWNRLFKTSNPESTPLISAEEREQRLAEDQRLRLSMDGLTEAMKALEQRFGLRTEKELQEERESQIPAQVLESGLTLNELVCSTDVREKLDEVLAFARNRQQLQEVTGKNFPKGYIALLHGPGGTGKTSALAALSDQVEGTAYRIDSVALMAESAELVTEQLAHLFQGVESEHGILYLDEAEVLFGRLATAKNPALKQQLLERLEAFSGLVLLTTRDWKALDENLLRLATRFIEFELPTPAERQQLWQLHLPSHFAYATNQLVEQLATDYPLSGASIVKVLHRAIVRATNQEARTLTEGMLLPLVQEEYNQQRLIQEAQQEKAGTVRRSRSSRYNLPGRNTPQSKPTEFNTNRPPTNIYETMSQRLKQQKAKQKRDGVEEESAEVSPPASDTPSETTP